MNLRICCLVTSSSDLVALGSSSSVPVVDDCLMETHRSAVVRPMPCDTAALRLPFPQHTGPATSRRSWGTLPMLSVRLAGVGPWQAGMVALICETRGVSWPRACREALFARQLQESRFVLPCLHGRRLKRGIRNHFQFSLVQVRDSKKAEKPSSPAYLPRLSHCHLCWNDIQSSRCVENTGSTLPSRLHESVSLSHGPKYSLSASASLEVWKRSSIGTTACHQFLPIHRGKRLQAGCCPRGVGWRCLLRDRDGASAVLSWSANMPKSLKSSLMLRGPLRRWCTYSVSNNWRLIKSGAVVLRLR